VILVAFATALLLMAYALWRGDLAKTTGLLFLLAAAYAAARHQRHVSIYAVAWACYAPAALRATPLASMLGRALAPGRRPALVAATVAALAGCGAYGKGRPWAPELPAEPRAGAPLVYPVDAVGYLRAHGFRGNLLTPFSAGAFVTWELYPAVRVSLDGRYEVAYQPDLLDRHLAFYRAEGDWERLIEEPPADAVLARSDAPVVTALERHDDWRRVYRDDAYEVFARENSALPAEDRRGERLTPETRTTMIGPYASRAR
jgi:hypothetical protein